MQIFAYTANSQILEEALSFSLAYTHVWGARF